MNKERIPDLDSVKRQGYAIGLSFHEKEDGTLRLVLDDLELEDGSTSVWYQRAFFTFIDLPRERVLENKLSERELSVVGEMVLARLAALNRLDPIE